LVLGDKQRGLVKRLLNLEVKWGANILWSSKAGNLIGSNDPSTYCKPNLSGKLFVPATIQVLAVNLIYRENYLCQQRRGWLSVLGA